MKTGRQIGRRSLGVVLALALLLSCTFMAAPVTAGTLLAAAEGGLSFTVPETIYLAPTESSSGSTQLLYYLNVNPDGSVPRGYSTTGTVRFSNAAASSVQITCSDTSVTLSASGSANAYSATIGGRLSSGLMPGETRTLTWTAQYTESGQTKTVRSYSVVYAPFINPVGAIAAGTANKGYDVTASCSTFIYGIHQVVNSGRICDYSYLHDLYQVESNETSTTSRIDGTGVYRYSLVNGSAVPSAYPGGAEPTQLMKSTDASPGPSSLSGTAFSWSSSHATARRVFVFGGTGRVFYDTARVTEIGQIPCFEVKSFLNGAEGSASLSTSAEDFREAAYYSMSNSSVGNTSAPLTTTQYWGGSNRTTDVVCVPSPTLGSVALTGGTQSLIHGVDRFWRSKYTVDSGSDFSEKGEAVAVAACEFVGVDKSTARARYLAEVSAARQPGSSTDAWNNYRTQMQLLAQYLGTPTATSFDFSALNNAVSALIQSRTTTLTVDPNGGKWADNSTAPKSYSQAPGTTFMPSETPTRSGYEFIGWQLSGGGSWNGTTFTFGSADCTLNAQWRQAATMQTLHIQPGYLWIQRAVSFEEMKITQAQGTTIPVPTNVYMQNKVFRGWNQPSNGTLGGNLSDIQYAVSGSGGMGELLFSRHTYTFGTAEHDGLNPIFSDLPSGKAAIAVNPDGGSLAASTITYKKGGANKTLPSSASTSTQTDSADYNTTVTVGTPTKTGYKFGGWTGYAVNSTNVFGYMNGKQTNGLGSYTQTVHTEEGGYTNYKWNIATATTSGTWSTISFQTYSVQANETITVSGYFRVNSGSQIGINLYHGDHSNDYQNGSLQNFTYANTNGEWIYFKKSRTFTHELITFKIGKVYAVGLKLIIISGDSRHLHFDVLQQLNEIVHIQDVRYVADNDRVTAQQGGTDNLQRLVLSTLWSNGTTQRMTAFDDK